METSASPSTTPRYVSVKFDAVGRTHSFLLPEVNFEPRLIPGEAVVVQRGERLAYAAVAKTIPALAERKALRGDHSPRVLRRATRDDVLKRFRHEQREREAHRLCSLKIREHGLQMKLVKVEQRFDGSKLLFFFTAEGRVDFRNLVRELAGEFRVRIEMRQIGSRDEAKVIGGYGTCGRPLCCTTWLPSFEPISIKMAKRQNLSLNPSRLSGACGRLKCCLRFELPNAKGEQHAGCAHERSCSNAAGGCGGCDGGCGPGGCGSG